MTFLEIDFTSPLCQKVMLINPPSINGQNCRFLTTLGGVRGGGGQCIFGAIISISQKIFACGALLLLSFTSFKQFALSKFVFLGTLHVQPSTSHRLLENRLSFQKKRNELNNFLNHVLPTILKISIEYFFKLFYFFQVLIYNVTPTDARLPLLKLVCPY